MEIRPIVSALLRSRTGAVLIAAQVALTLAIVSNAIYVVDTRLATARRASGVDEANLFMLAYQGAREIDERAGMIQRDLEVLRALPGVVAASDVNQMPMTQSGWNMGLAADPTKPGSAIGAAAYFTGSSPLAAFGLRLVEGRDFAPSDYREVDSRTTGPSSEVVLVTRALGKALLPDRSSPLGATIYLGTGSKAKPMRVVGVVDRLMTPWGRHGDEAYFSFLQPLRYLTNGARYAVRTEPGQRARVMAEAEEALSALRSDRVMVQNRSLGEVRERRYKNERAGAAMLVAVTIGLLVVTGSGIVGIASLWVSQRRKQIGIRRALGATRLDILRYFVTENLLITTGGVVAGVALAIGVNQLLVSNLELGRLPLGYVLGGVVVLWGLGVVAVLGPAWRAAAVPPAVATRSA
jgi:putative ABC transport system permease protein